MISLLQALRLSVGVCPTHHGHAVEVPTDDPKFSSVILAKVGPWNVTAQEFLLSYEYGPAFSKRASDSKKHYLTYMIYEKLLALNGYDRGLQSSPMVQEMLMKLKPTSLPKSFTKTMYSTGSTSPIKKLSGGCSKENVHLGLKWLFSPTKEDIFQAGETVA